MSPKTLARRLLILLTRRRFERDLSDEIQLHIDLRAARQVNAGATPSAAGVRARAAFGSTLRVREESRDAWGWLWLDHLRGSLRDAARSLTRSRLEWPFAVLMLAIGVGIVSGAWVVLRAVLLTAPPYPSVDQLVVLDRPGNGLVGANGFLSGDDVLRLQQDATLFEGLASYETVDRAIRQQGDAAPRRAQGTAASPNFFQVLGIHMASGRAFHAEDADAGARPTIVLGASLAREMHVTVGISIEVNGVSADVIGIAPDGFTFPDLGARFYLPEAPRHSWLVGDHGAGGQTYPVIARLRPNVSVAAAGEEAHALLRHEEHPVAAHAYRELVVTPVRSTVIVIQIAAGLVLLLATLNLSWLLCARAQRRLPVYGLLAALGASPGRLLAHYFSEVFLLTLAATPGAMVVAWTLVSGLLRVQQH